MQTVVGWFVYISEHDAIKRGCVRNSGLRKVGGVGHSPYALVHLVKKFTEYHLQTCTTYFLVPFGLSFEKLGELIDLVLRKVYGLGHQPQILNRNWSSGG